MTSTRRSAPKPGVFYYALGSWRARPLAGDGYFTLHEKSSYPSVILGLGLLTTAELVPVHLLLSRWTPIAAWLATGLALYGMLWFVADWRATCLRPIRLGADGLELHAGLRWDVSIPLDAIASIERPGRDDSAAGRPLKLSLFADPDLVVRTRRPVEARGLSGLRRHADAFAFAVDEPQRLIDAWHALRDGS